MNMNMNPNININNFISFSIEASAAPDLSKLTLPPALRQQAFSSYIHSIDSIDEEKRLLQKYDNIKIMQGGNIGYKEILVERRSRLAEQSKLESIERSKALEQEKRRQEQEKQFKLQREVEASEKRAQILSRLENMRAVLNADLSDDICTHYVERARGNVTQAADLYKIDLAKTKDILKRKKSTITDEEVKGYLEMSTSGIELSPSFNIIDAAVQQYDNFN